MTPTDSRADLAIIGSGSAAFAAAIAATNLGKRVVMVERGTVGGTCVNVGCVPSKALLAAAEARHTAAAAGRFPGLTAATVPVDFADLIAGKDALVEHLRTDKYVDLATDYGWEIVSGTAVFDGAPATPALRVELTGGGTRVIEADHYLIATGASPSVPPVAGLAEAGYLTRLGASVVVDRGELSDDGGRALARARWAGAVDAVGSHTLANVLAQIKPEGCVAACGLAQGMDLTTTVAPFILRGVTLRGVHSVYVPRPRRLEAWRRLDEDLDRDLLASMTRVVGLAEVPGVSEEILAGRIRGRVVVDVNA